jgi:cobalt-zinc-cadmium efflux system outer membrane protein
MEQRLITDVRYQYFEVLIAQEKVKVADNLVEISSKAVEMTKALMVAKEVAKTSVLQSEIELQNALVVKRQAENERIAARRKLAALLNEADVPFQTLAGNAREITEVDEFDSAYEQLILNSPELAELVAGVEQAKRTLARARVEPIPNVTWSTGVGYDDISQNMALNFSVGMPIPTRDKNQGTIQQARQQIIAAERNVDRKMLDLRQRLANAYQVYNDAKLQIDAYDSSILPKSKETLDLVSAGYQQEEVGFLQLLTAQRTYTVISLTYLEKLKDLRRQAILINGRLLSGNLGD